MSGGRSFGSKGFGYSGFAIPPPKSLTDASSKPGPPKKGISVETHLAQMGYQMPNYGSKSYSHLGKKRIKSEEDYFEEDDDEAIPEKAMAYQPAPGSPNQKSKPDVDGSDSDSSVDPLDAYMTEVKHTIDKETDHGSSKSKKKNFRDDIEEEDDEESYYRYVEEHPQIILDEEEDLEYDEDGNAIIPESRKVIDPLPPIDHSEIIYTPFNKNFYEEHEEISALSELEINELRNKLNIKVSGIMVQRPVISFAHFNFPEPVMKQIRKMSYEKPTPIQSQGVPIAMAGRDIIGIAKTGSGKTAAYLWPLIIHIMDQKNLQKGDGPIGLVLAPTRELCQQIYQEAKKFGKAYNINVVCAYGGGSMWEQCKACEEGTEIIIATPGRIIDLVKKKATNLQRVSYLVFDEADRMFDLGFEPQVRSIADHVRPDRQCLMFSATMRRKVERISRDLLSDPIKILQGELGEANEDVTQIVKVLANQPAKWNWVTARMVGFVTDGSVLVFVTRKANSEEIAENLRARDFKVILLHGDMNQTERNEAISSFKRREVPIMVATDVASRGLDIPHIKTVINYDVARDIDTHTHRIGRTGRAGVKGVAFTMITPRDRDFAGLLVRNLEGANQLVPNELIELALQNAWFKKSRVKEMKAKKLNMNDLSKRERPGLGSTESSNSSSGGSALPSSFSMYEARTNIGPQGDRLSAMRAAFKAQFTSQFVASEEEPPTQPYVPPVVEPPIDPSVPPRKRKNTRWQD